MGWLSNSGGFTGPGCISWDCVFSSLSAICRIAFVEEDATGWVEDIFDKYIIHRVKLGFVLQIIFVWDANNC